MDGGLEDVLQGTAAPDLATGETVLQTQLQSWGITQIFTTLSPCGGYPGYGSTPDACSTTAEGNRTTANNSIATNFSSPFPAPCLTAPSSACTFADDFSAALWDGNTSSPEQDLISADNSGDGVNLTAAGYAAAAATDPVVTADRGLAGPARPLRPARGAFPRGLSPPHSLEPVKRGTPWPAVPPLLSAVWRQPGVAGSAAAAGPWWRWPRWRRSSRS